MSACWAGPPSDRAGHPSDQTGEGPVPVPADPDPNPGRRSEFYRNIGGRWLLADSCGTPLRFGTGFRNNQPEIRSNQPEIRSNQPEIRSNQPEIRSNQPEIRILKERIRQKKDESVIIRTLTSNFDLIHANSYLIFV